MYDQVMMIMFGFLLICIFVPGLVAGGLLAASRWTSYTPLVRVQPAGPEADEGETRPEDAGTQDSATSDQSG